MIFDRPQWQRIAASALVLLLLFFALIWGISVFLIFEWLLPAGYYRRFFGYRAAVLALLRQ